MTYIRTLDKHCYRCGETKLRGEFYSNRSNRGGLQSECKSCAKARRNARPYDSAKARQYSRISMLRRKYGMELTDYDRMVEKQSGLCAICNTGGRLAIDHDHTTGKVRKLLCWECNLGLGKFNESADLLRHAAEYLESH